MSRKFLNDQSLEYVASNGTTFKSDRSDLKNGVDITQKLKGCDQIKKMSDFAEFGAWHAFQIHPNLNGFSGYDAIDYNISE